MKSNICRPNITFLLVVFLSSKTKCHIEQIQNRSANYVSIILHQKFPVVACKKVISWREATYNCTSGRNYSFLAGDYHNEATRPDTQAVENFRETCIKSCPWVFYPLLCNCTIFCRDILHNYLQQFSCRYNII